MATPLPHHTNNLKELLKQEQEPFHVQNPKQNASFPSTFSRNACFCSSSSSSPDPFKKSPLLSPAPNNNKNPSDALFLHVPPKTAALLLQAALRVHHNPKSKTRIPNSVFGLLGSLIKKLRIRSRTRIAKTGDDDVVRWAVSAKTGGLSSSSSSSSSSSFCSTTTSATGNTSREEGKGEEFKTNNGGIGYGDFPLPRRRSPAFSSPAMSPTRPNLQENVNYEQNPPVKSLGEEDEEDKEQNSPVSILDPPFEDDESCEDGEEEGEFQRKDGEFNLECSYAFLQRAKRRVLLKLQNFEKLAELEPTKHEDRIVAEEDFPSTAHRFEINVSDFLVDVSCESSLITDLETPWMKRLVSDMFNEEERLNCRSSYGDLKHNQLIIKRVCNRLESWGEVEANTIDMMIDMDFREESDKWKKQEYDDEISRAATEVEFSIFSGLMEELLGELLPALDY